MASPNLSPLHRQIGRARRRVFVQILCLTSAWCWTGALAASALFLLLDKRFAFVPDGMSWLPWAVIGGSLGLATVLALVLAVLRLPSAEAVALTLDERFGLKERATTLLMLTPQQQQTPAGQALLADVSDKLAQLDVGSRFPVRLTWHSALVPACAVLLVLVSFMQRSAQAGDSQADETKTAPAVAENAPKINEKKNELKKKLEAAKEKAEQGDKLKGEDLDPDLKKFLSKPHETPEQIRQGVKELGDLEKQKQDQLEEAAKQKRDLAKELQQMKAMDKRDEQKEGPAKELNDKLEEGKLDEAKAEAQQLQKKLEKEELNDKEKEQLEKQLEQTKEKMERLAQQQDKRDQLDKLNKEGKLDDDKLEEEMKKLDSQKEKLKDLDDVAKKLGECKECMQKGDQKGAADAMKKAADKLDQMDKQEGQQQANEKNLKEQLDQIKDLRDEMRKGMDQGGAAMNKDGEGKGKRPEKETEIGKTSDSKVKADLDTKGQFVHDGYAPGQNFRKVKASEVAGQVEKATQEGPEALEQQPIPKPYRKTAKDYYDNLGDQRKKDEKK
jgi:hypothetical protein